MLQLEPVIEFLTSQDVLVHIIAFAAALPRLLVLIGMAPFFGPAVTGSVSIALVAALQLPLHPYLVYEVQHSGIMENFSVLWLSLIILKECLLGLAFTLCASLMFYVAISAGMIIDNQRGASQAQTSDLLTGEENSPFGSVLFLSLVTLFYASGAVIIFMSLFYNSYAFWPVFSLTPAFTSANFGIFMASLVNGMAVQALLLCAPFVLVALMSDVSLGLVNRFAPQLNVFILSMGIKSLLCALLIVFFIAPYFNIGAGLLEKSNGYLRELVGVLGGRTLIMP